MARLGAAAGREQGDRLKFLTHENPALLAEDNYLARVYLAPFGFASTTSPSTTSAPTNVVAGDQAVLVHNANPDCDPLRDHADSVRNKSGVKFVSGYTSPSGEKYYGHNRHGRQADGPSAEAIDRTGHHGGCAEVHCLIQAQEAEGSDAIKGGTCVRCSQGARCRQMLGGTAFRVFPVGVALDFWMI